ncbi:hypothetical protein BV25DRAFT_1919482, partial [Artomyces pyxidatus]
MSQTNNASNNDNIPLFIPPPPSPPQTIVPRTPRFPPGLAFPPDHPLTPVMTEVLESITRDTERNTGSAQEAIDVDLMYPEDPNNTAD